MMTKRVCVLFAVVLMALLGCAGQSDVTVLPTIPLTFQSLANQPTASIDVSDPASTQPTPTLDVSLYQHDMLKEHRIAYLITTGAVDYNHVVSPEGLEAGFGAVVIHDWLTLLEENAKEPFEAVIIHKSALSFIDGDWVTMGYRNAVVITLIDIYYPELPKLLGRCDTTLPTDPWYPRNFFITFELTYTIKDDVTYHEIQSKVAQCVPFADMGIQGFSGHSGGGESLEGPYGYRFFTGSLQTRLMDDIQRPVIVPTSSRDTNLNP